MTVYLDCNATTPIDVRIVEAVVRFMQEEYGNAGSRTHTFGSRAKEAVQRAREQVAAVAVAKSDEVIFTSGATESNNLAILGLMQHAIATGRRHIITTQIEHKAVLEPVQELQRHGFKATFLAPTPDGWIEPASVRAALQPDTCLVSIMHANNETGVLQPINDIARELMATDAFFHVDAAQGFGKDLQTLKEQRIDLISASGHKLYAPKGIGALIARRRGFQRAPLTPLFFGGGQERGLRPGTLPVPLIVGFGLAVELAAKESKERESKCLAFRKRTLAALQPLQPIFNGDQGRTLPHVVNLSLPGIDSEAVMVAIKDHLAISNGSACTSQSYEPSHVLKAMGLTDSRIMGALRLSWSYLTEEPDWARIIPILAGLR